MLVLCIELQIFFSLWQVSLNSSQSDLQRKKRRAPPPPTPPTPTMPNKTDEMEDKRQSTVGKNGSFFVDPSACALC